MAKKNILWQEGCITHFIKKYKEMTNRTYMLTSYVYNYYLLSIYYIVGDTCNESMTKTD